MKLAIMLESKLQPKQLLLKFQQELMERLPDDFTVMVKLEKYGKAKGNPKLELAQEGAKVSYSLAEILDFVQNNQTLELAITDCVNSVLAFFMKPILLKAEFVNKKMGRYYLKRADREYSAIVLAGGAPLRIIGRTAGGHAIFAIAEIYALKRVNEAIKYLDEYVLGRIDPTSVDPKVFS